MFCKKTELKRGVHIFKFTCVCRLAGLNKFSFNFFHFCDEKYSSHSTFLLSEFTKPLIFMKFHELETRIWTQLGHILLLVMSLLSQHYDYQLKAMLANDLLDKIIKSIFLIHSGTDCMSLGIVRSSDCSSSSCCRGRLCLGSPKFRWTGWSCQHKLKFANVVSKMYHFFSK